MSIDDENVLNRLSSSLPIESDISDREKDLSRYSRSDNTRRAYDNDSRIFEQFCQENGLSSLPATEGTVALFVLYLFDERNLKLSTIKRYLSTISLGHRVAGHTSPVQTERINRLLDSLQKRYGTGHQSKEALDIDKLQAMLSSTPDSVLGVRDRAILLMGFAGAFRRSELVSLNFDDILETKEGLVITLRRSKTDQIGQGRLVAISFGEEDSTCPVKSWLSWKQELIVSGLDEGAVFRSIDRHGNIKDRLSDKAVGTVVKRYAKAIGLDPNKFGGHSLRSGFATTAAHNGATDREIMSQTGHKSRVMVDRYVQQANLFKNNASSKLGL